MKKFAFLLLTTVSLFLTSCEVGGPEPGHDNSIINAKSNENNNNDCLSEDCSDISIYIINELDSKQPTVIVKRCSILEKYSATHIKAKGMDEKGNVWIYDAYDNITSENGRLLHNWTGKGRLCTSCKC